jgi:thiol-disulfide isomerase/thioredoxin
MKWMECLVLIAFLLTMNKTTNPRFRITLKRCSTRFPLLLACAGIFAVMAGRGLAGSEATGTEKDSRDSLQNRSVGISSPPATASKPSGTDSKRGTPDAQSLAGRSTEEVEAALGKPSGKLQNAQGALWLYAAWKVQFDADNHVLKVEKDQPMRLSKLDPNFVASSDAVSKGAYARAAAEDAARVKAAALLGEQIRTVSNGGEQVDLLSLMTPGKITIVDFYADWCGPCRRLSPQLEQLAKSDPDIVLLKIDIVNWNTPVTRQFGIQSVPNVRVFGRTGAQLGDATPEVSLVKKRVEQAKGS